MAIYVFNLLVGWAPNGVDNAQGYRAKMLSDIPRPIIHIFTDLPQKESIKYYNKLGIDIEQMLSVHFFMANHVELKKSIRIEDKLEELKGNMSNIEIEYQETQIRLKREGIIFASMLFDVDDKAHLNEIFYFKEGRLIRKEAYTDSIVYAEYFMTEQAEDRIYAKLVRRTFYDKDGMVAYDQVFDKGGEWYLFPDGNRWTKQQFIAEYIKKLNLSEEDTVILDRTAQFDFVQPLFQFGNKARKIAIIHSEHYFEKGRDSNWYHQYINWEYLYIFKYLKLIDTIVVSTQEQKESVIEILQKYSCIVPNIDVIPVGGIECLRYPKGARRSCSLISVSRIQPRKRPEWIVKSVVKAHRINPNITLDIYGSGSGSSVLEEMIEENQARRYIRMMGYGDVTNVYKDYEVFITASIWETLGLSTMEAIGSGTAVIGLDVPYGNRLFIRSEENGYLIDYDMGDVRNVDEEKLTDVMAEKIVQIFEDKRRLEEFHQKSYEIAKSFLSEVIKQKWEELLL